MSAVQRVTLTIDGQSVSVSQGTTVMQAAEQIGIFIPRYCYHPGLSIAGNCRICLVEIEKVPKLQISCNTPAAEGMMVLTQSPRVLKARRAVLEFLLINHPLDCPVCDQSGECDLQNYYQAYGQYDARFTEQKVKKPKAVPLGPTVMLDAERCILCSRCERFTDEVSKTGDLGIFNRGDKAQVGLYPGKALDHSYSGNVVDLCPVGALTDREFRFKARVWYLSAAPSICTGCAQGCNIDLHYTLDRPHLAEGARVMRVKPRHNAHVNHWWMCDEGRYGYKFIDRERLTHVRLRGAKSSWEAALSEVAVLLHRIRVQERYKAIALLPSTQLTLEEMFLVSQLGKALGVKGISSQVPARPGYSDDFLIQADKSPNAFGARLIGFGEGGAQSAEELIQHCLSGKVDLLWVFGHDLVDLFGKEKAKQVSQKVKLMIFQGANENPTCQLAHCVLPSAVFAEKDGVFVNAQVRAQRVTRAFDPLAGVRADWEILLDVGARLGVPFDFKTPEEIFALLGEYLPAFKGLTYERLGSEGVQLTDVD